VNVGTVVANTEENITIINRKAINVAQTMSLVFFICSTQLVLSRTELNNNRAKMKKNDLILR